MNVLTMETFSVRIAMAFAEIKINSLGHPGLIRFGGKEFRMEFEEFEKEYKLNLKKLFSLGELTPEYCRACDRLTDLEDQFPEFASKVESEL